MFEGFVFGPGIDAVKDDAFLAGANEVFGFGDGLADDPIFTFSLANHFAEFAFVVGTIGDTTFFHFLVNHAAKVHFRSVAFGKVIYGDGLATATHADDGYDFDISRI